MRGRKAVVDVDPPMLTAGAADAKKPQNLEASAKLAIASSQRL